MERKRATEVSPPCIVDGEIGITEEVQEDERRSTRPMGSYRSCLEKGGWYINLSLQEIFHALYCSS